MYKVADYLTQAQAGETTPPFARLRVLDTRGGASAVASVWFLMVALMRLIAGRINGSLAGVHVNMAERLSLFRKGLVVAVAHFLGIPVVLHLHAAQLHHFYRKLPYPLRALTRWVFSLPVRCIVLGKAARKFVVEELGVQDFKVEMVINGVPEPTFPRRRAEPGATLKLLFLGNLSERKGVSDLLRALSSTEFSEARVNLKVLIAGGGDLDAYRKKAAALELADLVEFIGWADQQTAARLLADADGLVLPSYDEGLPLVILEALANGVAVICTPVGEIPDFLRDGANACFVQPGDARSIASGLLHVLQQKGFRDALEENGRILYKERFSLDRFFEHVSAIHKQAFGVCGQPRQTHVDVESPPCR